ncbi:MULTISPECIES: DUF3107 domain-containing protein [Yimella]|uniref:Uncharacterized protein DUF3107 n=1 Tax=Yimella lutea TaxID=587872 RepID=A0A542EEM6_9MICO|nr:MULTISPECIES: DUF3107 domain-containing protein [Yimella]MCG8655987.1 DUF3107 domain-containing protein [Yimella sp. NH-Cas1]RYG76080.1 DUF3107 domain-containing protein [Yimella sp. RIT 621]TQJ13791.1 uncharacterized protein DUF3107 [Yimella lutea]
MEIRIGVRNIAREIVIESTDSADQVRELITNALSAGTAITLTDEKGHTVVVPAEALGYVDIGSEQERRVGFGS